MDRADGDGSPGREERERLAEGAAGSRDERSLTAGRLAEIARDEPWRLSPGVLARPLFQDHLFPTAAYVAGPAEVAYLAQSSALYPLFGATAPLVIHRPTLTLLEPAAARFLEKQGLPPSRLLLDAPGLRRELAEELSPAGARQTLERARGSLEEALVLLEHEAARVDPTLARPAAKAREGSLGSLDKLRGKLQTAIERREAEVFGALDRALAHLLPGGQPQERELSGLPFLLRCGPGLLEELLAIVEPFSGEHLVVRGE
jgi:uncharacterized protein YllA (UPF0747 family)